ncbi:EAL domain-containing protein [Actinokineospora diospyrosa]|uniref:PAS domain S-box-containing protein/diguanylate cyclase (GGDEF) domain-containing protein n=1 Tax=Actinokineospora diospyrosa TaxID=103728 RepID=A0ABT1I517_9PSEU|nr:EAL domain-containing protein [Actinokineospora diospyrosa]MCP2267728.1 PAS domain S-box-containing protein/diguanylate cyclase (GGDEF) domain-containing protein [Actinokineospora diospyrosa]
MDRLELATEWAAALTTVVSAGRAMPARELEDMIATVVADPARAAQVGAALVAAGYRDPRSLEVSVSALASGLLRLTTVDATAVALAALASGFAEAVASRPPDALVLADFERDLRASEGRFRELFTTSALGMVISDLDGGSVRANEALAEMLGHRPGTLEPGSIDELFHPQEREYLRERYDELAAGVCDSLHERTQFVRADGETTWVRIGVSLLRDRDDLPAHHVTMVEDISDLYLLENRLSYQGTHDPLTGLPNRQAFLGRLEEALSAGADVSVFHLGLDDFAVINDGISRDAGDHLLREVAKRLREVVGEHPGVVARLTGDEFAIMLVHGPGDLDVGTFAAEINEVLAEATYVDGEGVAASATIAVMSLPSPTSDPDELLRATDIARRRLKLHGRRQWCMVDPEQNLRYREHYRLAAGIPGAWENGELDLDLWPLVSLADHTRIATQALLRWEHPKFGTLGSERLEQILRDTGLGVPLGHWVLHHAAQVAAGACSALYLELTPEQAADPDLVMVVRRVLAETGLEADRLELGMPVQSLCSPDMPAEENLNVLVDIGVRSVLTGFGRSRGDLACLEDLPIQTVRMSEHVVRRLAKPDPHALFTRATLGLIPMVREVGISVLVTGLTETAQAQWWAQAGADLASGPLFA